MTLTPTETTTRLQGGVVTAPVSEAERRLAQLEQFALGSVELASGQTEGAVTGLGLAFTPTRVDLTMQIPPDGLSLDVVQVGAPTADGFAWRLLNGAPDSNAYKFTWKLS